MYCSPAPLAPVAPLSMGFSRQEYWSGLLCPPSGDLPDPGIEPESPVASILLVDSLPLSHWGNPIYLHINMRKMKRCKERKAEKEGDTQREKERVYNNTTSPFVSDPVKAGQHG